MSDQTYTARFVGHDETTTEELTLIDGLPQKSVTRPGASDGEDLMWELDDDAGEGGEYVYRSLGVSGHDYS
ncbi:hypothetical protein [Frigoribacterium sp. PhB24]|uniref:hypothetical protein n=1 Tax=Frigoribacterium sp. PhB24 TaxID=2485204 RepID=UPI000F47D140|nr:hypothetical protein [Frigoribacterium sp. PhB24]ROS50297.1 hypothetical protein EDF50_2086 [Frigoribacterium sp. PhB24]